jgi:hypothetical protein
MKLTERDIDILEDIFANVRDKLRHGQASELGWDAGDVDDFYNLVKRHREAAKAAGFWWAKN